MLHAKDIVSDWVKVGTMLIVSFWLGGGSIFHRSWQKHSMFTLIGFTLYHLTTRNIPTADLESPFKEIANDSIKFSTMFIVSRLLAGASITDTSWLIGCASTLVGFAVYNIVISKYLKGKDLTHNTKLQNVVDDWGKVGTMLLVSRLISCESILDPRWASSSLGVILGFSAYDVATSRIVDAIF